MPLGVENSISFSGSTITGSFNIAINNTTVSVNLTIGQTTAVAGILGISNMLSSALSNPQLGNLLSDEIALGVENYFTSPAISSALGLSSSVVNTLKSDEATLTAAIAANSMENALLGQMLGTLAFDATMNAMTSPQPTI